jgi:hypothetical protein
MFFPIMCPAADRQKRTEERAYLSWSILREELSVASRWDFVAASTDDPAGYGIKDTLTGKVWFRRMLTVLRRLYYPCPTMLLLHGWNRLLALTLLSVALFCIVVPSCDGVDVVLASQQPTSLSSLQSTNLPDTPSGDVCGCWCCCASVIVAGFHIPVTLSPLMQAEPVQHVQYRPVDLPIPTHPPRR